MRQVSVIIAAHNSAETIGRAVRSALSQPETAEVIVVDDASDDATPETARLASDGDTRLHVEVLPINRGPSAARNVALKNATGTFVCVLDADDWMEDARLGRLLAAAGDDWDFAADDLLLLDANSVGRPTPMLALSGRARRVSAKEFVQGNLPGPIRRRREMGYLKPLIRRSFLEEHGPLRYDETLRLGEDFILYATALGLGARFVVTPACGYVAVQRPGSLSHIHSAWDLLALARADDRLLAVIGAEPETNRVVRTHQRLTLDKHCHRVALDAKRRGDWLGVARALLGTRSSALHILRQTLEAKTGAA